MLGNKCDMNDRRQVSRERGAAVSKLFLITIPTGFGLEDVFYDLDDHNSLYSVGN